MNSAQEKLLFFLGYNLSVILGAQKSGIAVNVDDCARCMMGKILEVAENDLPFSHLVENSDIVLHAEGPGALHHLPWLSSFNWLTSVADSNLRKLAATVLDIEGADGKRISRALDIRLGGMAPGSLWIGFKIVLPKAEQDAALAELLISNITHLPDLCRFIEDEGINSAINESVADPAMRDAGLAALLRFAPTGKKGIHTLQILSHADKAASLSQHERVVLQESLEKPMTTLLKEGIFTGDVRQADFDKTRIHLRNVHGIGSIRCVVRAMTASKALVGKKVRVEGRYECDREGRPRLMFVERITPMQEHHQFPL